MPGESLLRPLAENPWCAEDVETSGSASTSQVSAYQGVLTQGETMKTRTLNPMAAATGPNPRESSEVGTAGDRWAGGPALWATFRRVNYPAVVVAAVVSLVASATYYIVFNGVWLSLRGIHDATASRPQAWEIAGQFGRNLVVALALAYLLNRLGPRSVHGALPVAVLVWMGFQATAIAGSVLHEHYPVGLFILHNGDALMTTLIMTLILSTWRRRPAPATRG
jgi:hypothetical protein